MTPSTDAGAQRLRLQPPRHPADLTVMPRRTPNPFAVAIACVMAMLASPPWAIAIADPGDPEPPGRIVRHFDFEELEIAPIRLPQPWLNLADELGLPRFGDWAVRNDRAASGRWALRLDPDGASMAFGIPSGVVLVYPMTDYRIRTRIRTEGIAHGRVQIAAVLCDADGRPIPESLVRSRAVRSPDRWSTIETTVPGLFPEAVSLKLELHLLQPSHAGPATTAAVTEPIRADVTGSVWFDDVTIEHRSRVELATNAIDGIIIAPIQPTISIAVHDLTTSNLTARLKVRDAEGREVLAEEFQQLRSGETMQRVLQLDRLGWYEASISVRAPEGLVGEQRIPFAWVAPPTRSRVLDTGRLGVSIALEELPSSGDLAAMIASTNARLAVLPVWPPDDPRVRRMPEVLDRLLDRGVDVVAELAAARPSLAAAAGVDPHQVAAFLARAPEGWRTDLEPLVASFGLRVSHWTVGPLRLPSSTAVPTDPADVPAAVRRLGEALPAPLVMLAESAVVATGTEGADELIARIPAEADPHSIPEWVDGRFRTIQLELPPIARAMDAEIDLALRVLHAWLADAETVLVHLPFQQAALTSRGLDPGPTLPALRTLADNLQGRRVVTTLRLGDGVHALLLAGRDHRDAALAIWRDGRAGEAPRHVAVRLGASPVEQIGLRGERAWLRQDDRGRHVIPVSAAPTFVEGVDLNLLRFRAMISLSPDQVPAVYRAHEMRLRISNPWPVPVSGLAMLEDSESWKIRPLRIPFTLQPGESLEQPMSIVFDRAIVAGEQSIPVLLTVEGVETDTIDVALPVTIGWKDIDVAAIWRVETDPRTGRQDLLIRQFVTNRGVEPVQLDAFLRGPGLGRQQRPLPRLAAGETTARTFRVVDGVQRLAGQTLRYGIRERGGSAQLNRPLAIPAMLAPDSATAAARTDPPSP